MPHESDDAGTKPRSARGGVRTHAPLQASGLKSDFLNHSNTLASLISPQIMDHNGIECLLTFENKLTCENKSARPSNGVPLFLP